MTLSCLPTLQGTNPIGLLNGGQEGKPTPGELYTLLGQAGLIKSGLWNINQNP